MKNYESFKVQISHKTSPYIYMRLSLDDRSYRLSGNYKYLNEHYNLKLNFIRDLGKVYDQNKDNELFIIDDDRIEIKEINKWQKYSFGTIDNSLLVYHILLGTDTIMILHRNYKGDEDFSLFFSSNNLYNINQKLGEIK